MANGSSQHGSIDTLNSNIIEGWFFEEGNVDSYITLYINGIKTFDIHASIVRDDICKIFNLDSSVKTGFIVNPNTPISNKDCIVLMFNSTQKELEMPINNVLPNTVNCVRTDFLTIYSEHTVKFTVVTNFSNLSNTVSCDVLIINVPIDQKTIKQLQYVVYSDKLTATASCDNAIYIKNEALIGTSLTTSFNFFIQQTVLAGWNHKTIYNTLAFNYNFYTFLIENTSKYCFNFWYKHCERLNHNGNKNILFLISTQDGGTPLTNLDLMKSLNHEFNCYVLRSDSKAIYLSQLRGENIVELECVYLINPIKPVSHVSHEYDSYFINILYKYAIDIVHIRHVCWHSLTLHRATKFFNIPIIYSLHDYYAICPSHNLLDENLKYCGGACTSGNRFSKCNTVLWESEDMPPLKHCFITHWKNKFDTFLKQCAAFITTSVTTRDVYIKNYTYLQDKVTVIPHGRDLTFTDYRKTSITDNITVAVPGILAVHKGTEFLLQLKQLDVYNNIKFVFIGPYIETLKGVGEFHGVYNREDSQAILNNISPHIALIPSIWPETYCHVLTEMWSCNIPTIVLNYGAQAERTEKTNNGWVFDNNAKQVYDFLQKIINNPNILKEKKINFNNTSCKKMAQKYKKIYLHLTKK